MGILKKIAVFALALFSLTVFAAAPASAENMSGQDRVMVFKQNGEVGITDADSCNSPSWGTVCVNVGGSGLFVSRASGSHVDIGPTSWICNKEFHLWGHYRSGGQWHRNAVAGCGYQRVWVDFDINDFMADGSQVCADMKEYGTGGWHANGFACVRIHA